MRLVLNSPTLTNFGKTFITIQKQFRFVLKVNSCLFFWMNQCLQMKSRSDCTG